MPESIDPRTRLAYERTHLSNERTFAAWLRTGISVAAGGIAIAHLVPQPSRDSLIALALGGAFVLLGIGIMIYGAHEFAGVRHQLVGEGAAEGRLRGPSSSRALYGLTAVIGILLLAVLLFLWSHRGQAPRAQSVATTDMSSAHMFSAHRFSAHVSSARISSAALPGPLHVRPSSRYRSAHILHQVSLTSLAQPANAGSGDLTERTVQCQTKVAVRAGKVEKVVAGKAVARAERVSNRPTLE